MNKVINSVLANIDNRMKNPFLGSFFISWIVINWKPIIYLLFSGDIIEDKILNISSDYSDWIYLFLYPLLIGLFYSVVFPYLNLGLNQLLKVHKAKMRKNFHTSELQKYQDSEKIEIAKLRVEEVKVEFTQRKKENDVVENLRKVLEDSQLKLKHFAKISEATDEQRKNELEDNQRLFQKELNQKARDHRIELTQMETNYLKVREQEAEASQRSINQLVLKNRKEKDILYKEIERLKESNSGEIS